MKSVLKLMLALALCFAIVLTVAACGNKDGDVKVEKPVDKSSISIVNGEVLAYDKDGNRINYDRQFVEVDGNTYYAINNMVVTGDYVISGQAYAFDASGVKLSEAPNNKFITCEGATYYAVNGTVVSGRQVIDNYIYQFGQDGKMITGEFEGYTYVPDGKLMYDGIVTFEDEARYNVPGQLTEAAFVDGFINPLIDVLQNITAQYLNDVKTNYTDFTYEEIDYVFSASQSWGGYDVLDYAGNLNFSAVQAYLAYLGEYLATVMDNYGTMDDARMDAMNGAYETVCALMNCYRLVDPVNGVNTDLMYRVNLYSVNPDATDAVYVCMLTSENDEDELEELEEYLATYLSYNAQTLAAQESACMYDGSDMKYTVVTSYYLVAGYITEMNLSASGTLYESDADRDDTNNPTLSGAYGTLTMADGTVYTATTDSEGNFDFGTVAPGAATLTFELYNYITINVQIDNTALFDFSSIVMDRNVSNNLQGRVFIADADTNGNNNYALAGATVKLVRTSGTNVLVFDDTTTDSSGYYYFYGLTAGAYELVIECEGYITIQQTVYVRYNETTVYNASLEAIPEADDPTVTVGSASGTILDARTGNAISGLAVYIYPGVNNVEGAYIVKLYTDANGQYAIEGLEAGNYTAYIVDERDLTPEEEEEGKRYGALTIAVKILAGENIPNQGTTVSNSEGLSIDGMRVVLTWGSSPSDLDSHMLFGSSHVYYSNKTSGSVSLDVDDTSSYGPETITVESIGDYTYKYYIYNFSGSGTMSGANATVKVYFGTSSEPAYTFYAPSGSGLYWKVFTYNAVTGEFTVVNSVSSSSF